MADEGQGGRQRGQQVVRQVDGHHLVTKLLNLLCINRINIEFRETVQCSSYAKSLTVLMLNYLDWDIHELHHGQVQLPVLQLVLEVVPSRHAYIGTSVLWPLKTGE